MSIKYIVYKVESINQQIWFSKREKAIEFAMSQFEEDECDDDDDNFINVSMSKILVSLQELRNVFVNSLTKEGSESHFEQYLSKFTSVQFEDNLPNPTLDIEPPLPPMDGNPLKIDEAESVESIQMTEQEKNSENDRVAKAKALKETSDARYLLIDAENSLHFAREGLINAEKRMQSTCSHRWSYCSDPSGGSDCGYICDLCKLEKP